MALSNIFREPRRELIEQGYGFAALVAVVAVNLSVAALVCLLGDGTIYVTSREFFAADIFGIVITGALIGAMLAVHALGESLCNAMARHGRDPRPVRREA